VAGTSKGHRDSRCKTERFTVAETSDSLARRGSFVGRVEGKRRAMLRRPALVVVEGLFLLEVPGVGPQELQKVHRGARRQEAAAEPILDETQHVAAVVDVAVREHDVIDGRRIGGQALPFAKT
jgi:hypothetical protein